jgi:hypothetical protein
MAWVGARVRSLDPVPGVGTWKIVDHEGCPGDGRLNAMTRDDPAPLCPVCGAHVTWELAHLAPSVSSDHLEGRAPAVPPDRVVVRNHDGS